LFCSREAKLEVDKGDLLSNKGGLSYCRIRRVYCIWLIRIYSDKGKLLSDKKILLFYMPEIGFFFGLFWFSCIFYKCGTDFVWTGSHFISGKMETTGPRIWGYLPSDSGSNTFLSCNSFTKGSTYLNNKKSHKST
jgi:hypothetical protein